MSDIVVIGAGHNGLIAAAMLAKAGHRVTVLERHDTVGGLAITRAFAEGYRAPTLAPAIGPLHQDVLRALKRVKFDAHALQLITPDPALTTLGRAGDAITFQRDPVFTAESINRVASNDAGRWREFIDSLQRLSSVCRDLNRHPAPDIDRASRGDVWRLLNTGRRARGLGKKNLSRLLRYLPMAIADIAEEWFDSDLLQGAIAARALYGHFAGPWSAGTGALLLQRLADDPMPVGSGITLAGGPGALTRALAETAKALGVTIRTNARVARILVKHGHAAGVALESGEEVSARAVLAALAPKTVLESLVDPAELPPTFRQRVKNIRARGATAKLNLALSARPVFPALHGDDIALRGRLLIAPDLDMMERAFDAAKYGELPAQPWLEISIPTIVDGSLAPADGHVMSIVAHTMPAPLKTGAWDDAREPLQRAILDTLAPHAPGLADAIVGAELITPADLESQWGLPGGHIYHAEQTIDQWWSMRPLLGWAGHTTPISRLFLTGTGTHGGGGITGLPGLHAARVVAAALSVRARE